MICVLFLLMLVYFHYSPLLIMNWFSHFLLHIILLQISWFFNAFLYFLRLLIVMNWHLLKFRLFLLIFNLNLLCISLQFSVVRFIMPFRNVHYSIILRDWFGFADKSFSFDFKFNDKIAIILIFLLIFVVVVGDFNWLNFTIFLIIKFFDLFF